MSAPRLSDSGKRLLRDLRNLHKDPPAGIMASPIDNDIYVWNSMIYSCVEVEGNHYWVKQVFSPLIYRPDETPYAGGKWT